MERQNDPTGQPDGQQPARSLADEILAMKAARDARLKAEQEAAVSGTPTPAAAATEAPAMQLTAPPVREEAAAPHAAPAPAPEAATEAPASAAQPLPETSPAADAPAVPVAEDAAHETGVAGSLEVTQHLEPETAMEAGVPAELVPMDEERFAPAAEPAAQRDAAAEMPADAPVAASSEEIDQIIAQPEAEAVKAPSMPEAAAPAAGVSDDVASDAAATVAAPAGEEAHAEEHEEHLPEHEEIDYSSYTKAQLAKEIKQYAGQEDALKHHRRVMDLHRLFHQRLDEEREEARSRFLETGGEADAFQFRPGPEDAAVDQLVDQLRDKRARNARQQEEVKVHNLQRKREILERLRQMVDASETKETVDELKRLQGEWKAIGAVPAGESQELWNSYHALLDQFYNQRSIYYELKELDRKRNLAAKEALVERAEALAQEQSINKALMELRHLHEEWKNIGPVPQENRDSIWDRFIQASETVHQRRKEYLSERKATEESNLMSKTHVLTLIEPFVNFVTDRINEWRSKTDEIQKVKEIWEQIGLVPKDKAEEINKKFWGAYKSFFHNKNAFFKALDEQKMENLRLKTAMCEEAEAAMNSNDWEGTKERLIQLQKKWKTVGRVPDKHSDEIWNRFRNACNAFFDKRTEEFNSRQAAQDKIQADKRAFLNELEQAINSPQEPASLEGLASFETRWQETGRGEAKASGKLEERFYDLAERYAEQIAGLSESERKERIFQLQVAHLKANPDAGQQLHKREQDLRKEIQRLEHSISTLKTNMDFFARSKNADQIRNEYSQRIEGEQQQVQNLKRQLDMLRSKTA